ncbi:MAG: phosphate signaling complex protein PhoU [Actinobacteria bacterium]|nr:phosphate signaling complex protein PhoU [Actinomycetota bacterium]
MSGDNLSHEIRHRFDELLEMLRRGSVEMGSLVLENTRRLADALLENDLGVAEAVIAADAEVDRKYVELERLAFETMARQQPVAGDLRFLVTITRLLYEIERSGDLVVNAAKGLVFQHGYVLSPEISGLLGRIAARVSELWAKGIEVLDEMDGEAAQWMDRLDDEVDDLVGEFYTLIGSGSETIGFDVAIELSRVGRYLERIADHAVNIAEHVTFIVTGAFPAESHPPHPRPEAG